MSLTREDAEAFLLDLEQLCRQHQIYLRSPFPTTRPILYRAYGDEAGFILDDPPFTGSNERCGWGFDRRLESPK